MYPLNSRLARVTMLVSSSRSTHVEPESCSPHIGHRNSTLPFNCNWHKANWDMLSSFYSSFDWNLCLCNHQSSNDCWKSFYDVICLGINTFVPSKKPINTKRSPSDRKSVV